MDQIVYCTFVLDCVYMLLSFTMIVLVSAILPGSGNQGVLEVLFLNQSLQQLMQTGYK